MCKHIKIKHFRKVNPDNWNKFADRSDSAWLYHRWQWQELMSKSWDGVNLSFAVGEDDKLVGIFPAFQMVTQPYLIDSGFGHGGFAYSGSFNKIEILKIVLTGIRNLYWNVLNKETGDQWLRFVLPAGIDQIEKDYEEYMKLGYFKDQSSQTMIIYLTSSEDVILSGYSTTTRQNIATAKKKGLICDELPLNNKSLDLYYSLHVDTYNRTGVKPHPIDYFKSMYDLMKPYYRIFAAFDSNGKIVSAENVATYKQKGFYSTGASSEEGLKLNASKAVQDYVIRTLRQEGFKSYEIGEVHPDAKPEDGKIYGLTRFKMSFGGELFPLRKIICKLDEVLNVQAKL